MLRKPKECDGCVGAHWGGGEEFTEAEGQPSLGVHLVGEGAGENEAVDGLPFRGYALAGMVLNRAITEAGRIAGRDQALRRSQFKIYNVIQCRPPNNWLDRAPWEYSAIAHCKVHREARIRRGKPRVIVALGKIPWRTFTGFSGEKRDNQSISIQRGYPHWNDSYKCWIIGSFHPAYIGRGNWALLPVLAFDIAKAVWLAKQDDWDPAPVKYITRPTPRQVRDFVTKARANPHLPIAYDLENPRQHSEEEKHDRAPITQIQFSLAPRTGICLTWDQETQKIAKVLLGLPNDKIGHNCWRYDNPILEEEGIKVKGTCHDTMVMFHHLYPDVDGCYGLQGVGSFYGADRLWKHLNLADPTYYGCMDVDVPQRILQKLPDQMRSYRDPVNGVTVWDSYLRHKVKFDPYMVAASKRGIPASRRRQDKLRKVLEEQLDTYVQQAQMYAPAEILNPHPRQGYVKQPPEITELVEKGPDSLEVLKSHDHIGYKDVMWAWRPFTIKHLETEEYEVDCGFCKGKGKKTIKAGVKECSRCKGTGRRMKLVKTKRVAKEEVVHRWCKLEPFNPGSAEQIKRYIRHRKHKMPRHSREDRDTTDDKAIKHLYTHTKDPMYQAIDQYKDHATVKSNFVDAWEVGPDGRVHPTFGYKTGTGQMTASKPNSQQIPKHKAAAKAFRECIRAPKGFYIVSFDWKALHAVTAGLEFEDADYMRLARLDIHSYLAAAMEGEPADINWPDKKLKAYLARIKKKYEFTRNYKAKRGILGWQFGMGGRLLYMLNQDIYENQSEAQGVVNEVNALFPVSAEGRAEAVDIAHRAHYRMSNFGYIRWFYDVKRTGGKKGDDYKKAINFRPANHGHCIKKEAILELGAKGLLKRCRFINEVHDDLWFLMTMKEMRLYIPQIKRIMAKPRPELKHPTLAPKGLAVDVEVNYGKDLANLKEWKHA